MSQFATPVRPKDCSAASTGDQTTTAITTSWDETHLRSALQAQLRRSGVVDQLRAQLRARIIEQLHPDSGVPGAGFRGRPRGGDATVIHTIVNALVTEFLAHQGLEYTLSVYLPETSQTLLMKMYGRKAHWIIRAVTVSVCDFQFIAHNAWIESLVKGVRELHVPCLSQQVQTEETDHERALRECAELVEVERESKRRAVLEVQRKYELLMEERVQQEVQKQVERFRDVEVKHVRLEAKEDWMRKMDAYKAEVDARHGERERRFLEEMEVAEAHVKQREMELNAAQMDLDRRLAVAQEAIQLKEEKLQHQQELMKQSRSIEETVMRRKIEDLQSQVNQLTVERDAAQRRLSDEVKRHRIYDRVAELRVLGEKRKVVDRYLREEESLRDNLEQARTTISDMQHQVSSLQAELGDARKKNAQLARSKPSRDERQELHALKAEFNLISATLAEHKEKVGLLKQSERKWQLECQQLIGQFEHERRRAKALAKRLHQEIEAKHDAETEAAQLRFLIKPGGDAEKMAVTSVRERADINPMGSKSSFFLEDPSAEFNSTVLFGAQDHVEVVIATPSRPTAAVPASPDSFSDAAPTPDRHPPVVKSAAMSRSGRGHAGDLPAPSPSRDAQPRRTEVAVDPDLHVERRPSLFDDDQEVSPRPHEPTEPAFASPAPLANPPPQPLFSKFLPRPDVPDKAAATATPLKPPNIPVADAAPMPSSTKSASVSRSGSRRNLPDVPPLGDAEPTPAKVAVDHKDVSIEPQMNEKEREKKEREAAQQAQIMAITQANPLLQEYIARAAAQRATTQRAGPALPAPDVEDTESVDYGAGETISAMSETDSSSRS
ncbi:hypothetical protein GGF31_002909 [Allomyces arbusculus]|nr:hypothetical protein GGF31_002909 [Allomyces arbusculus]